MSLFLKDKENLLTIHDWIRWIYSKFNETDIFYGHGLADSLDEALFLVLEALNLPVNIDKNFYNCRVTNTEVAKIIDLVERRITERKPLSYLLNSAWYCDLPFYIDERVLIPRSPISELIQKKFAPWSDGIKLNRVLDLCCGSGCIGIACALYIKDAIVDMIDVSPEALEVASINVDKFQLWNRVQLIKSNLFSAFEDTIKNQPPLKYQLIVSNPPYVTHQELEDLPAEYYHEPALALEAGSDGLDFVNVILKESVKYLDEKGLLIIEVGNSQENLQKAYPNVPFTWLEFQKGGHGVFLLTAEQCRQYFSKDN